MAAIELIVLLLAVSAALRVVAQRLGVPHPVLLAVGGLLIALVPGLPRVEVDPDALFLIFVPPILYWGARELSLRDFRQELGPILRLAVIMVLVTATAVAVAARALDPEFTWAAAFALGAIVAPPDSVAALTVTRSLRAPRSISNILEGEGLLNDATALVTYRIAVAAAVSGSFSASDAVPAFLLSGAGGVLIGLAVGVVALMLARLTQTTAVVANTFSLLTPFASFLAADLIGASGVVAAVATGIYVGRQVPRLLEPETRLQNEAMWNVASFLFESLIFILIGFELPVVAKALGSEPLGELLREAGIITACVILVRFVWVWPSAYLSRALGRHFFRFDVPYRSWKEVLFVGWAGMRGGESLVIALALPFTIASGAPFPVREKIIFITFVVILVTLVVQGLTVAPLLRALHLHPDERADDEEAHARLVAVEAGLRALDAEEAANRDYPEVVRYLRQRHRQRARRWAAREQRRFRGREHLGKHSEYETAPSHEAGELDDRRSAEYRRLRSKMIRGEQQAVVRLRDQDVIGDDVMRRILHDLDLEATLLAAPEPVMEPASEVSSSIAREAAASPPSPAPRTRDASAGRRERTGRKGRP
ncbi:MAG TPA: Na+/H+ antiporter [Gemmatimonadaceae bacterium]|nr:Na+/H+ antiporter [Gemmatimonadaceae bacterium]